MPMIPTVLAKSYALHYRTTFQGLPISIENRRGSYRHWHDAQGREGSTRMLFPYGYIRGTEGEDEEHIDVYLGPDDTSDYAFVVHQLDSHTGEYDEDKCFLGFNNEAAAKRAYLAHRNDGTRAFGGLTTMTMGEFRRWLKTQPPKSRRAQKSRHPTVLRRRSPRIGETLSSPFVGFDANPGSLAFVAGGGDRDTAVPNAVDFGTHVPRTRTWGPGTKRMPKRARRNMEVEGYDA